MGRGKIGALANLAGSSGASIVYLSCHNSEWNCYPLYFSFAWSPGEGSLGKGMTLGKAAFSVEADFEGGWLFALPSVVGRCGKVFPTFQGWTCSD